MAGKGPAFGGSQMKKPLVKSCFAVTVLALLLVGYDTGSQTTWVGGALSKFG